MTSRVFGVAATVLAAYCAGLACVVGASASTLGGLRVADLGASSATVITHTTGITATWGAALSGSNWVLDTVVLQTHGADRFAVNENIRLSLVDTTGARICEIPVTVGALAATVTISRAAITSACGSTPIAYSRIDQVALSAAS